MIRITSDTAWDMPKELYGKHGFEVVPVPVILGDKEFLDGVDITTDDIYKYYDETKKTPKTAATPPDIYREFFEERIKNGDEIVHISMSSGISTAFNQARKGAEFLKGVYVIDGESLSTGTSLLALKAADLRAQGKSAAEIVKEIESQKKRVQCSFVINSLEFLHKGGRCSGTTRLAAAVLKIKPTIEMIGGSMEVGKKYMGSWKSALDKYVGDTFDKIPNPDLTRIFITFTTADPDIVEMVKKKVEQRYKFKEIIINNAQCTITAHCGRNTLGILYLY